MRCVTDDKTDTERYGYSSVGIVFFDPTNSIVALNGGLFHGLGTFQRCVHRFPVGILHRTSGLIHHAFHFALSVTDRFTNAFLHVAGHCAMCQLFDRRS